MRLGMANEFDPALTASTSNATRQYLSKLILLSLLTRFGFHHHCRCEDENNILHRYPLREVPSSFQAKTAKDLAVIVGHPIGMCDEKYIVNEYLFWGPTPCNKWPTKNGVFFFPMVLVTVT